MIEPPAQANQSLIDGLEVLRALALAEDPVGSRQMARLLNMEPTRVNRLLKTLASLGVARQTSQRKYVPGPAMHVLSVQALHGSRLLARTVAGIQPLLPFGLDVALGVLWRRQVCYLYFRSPASEPNDAWSLRHLYPAELSAVGIPLLAELPPDELARLYSHEPPIGGMEQLQQHLRQCRARGYARLSRGRHRTNDALGIAVGTPPFAALALAGTFSNAQLPAITEALRSAATSIGSESSTPLQGES